MKKLGIIQGRLSEPIEGFQECPAKWRGEFDIIDTLGLSHIEWILTMSNFDSNPIHFNDVASYPVSSLCCDFIVNDSFCCENFLDKFLNQACEIAQQQSISNVTIPLLENSDIKNSRARKRFCKYFNEFLKRFSDLNFFIEAECSHEVLQEVLELRDNVYVTYDTGNITSSKINHQDYINALFDRIRCVHLKDRAYDAATVEPLTGDTDFANIFKMLSSKDYNGYYTLQTCRCDCGNEVETINRHIDKLRTCYEESI
jgi:sugar phosphate isomerase/epimerase